MQFGLFDNELAPDLCYGKLPPIRPLIDSTIEANDRQELPPPEHSLQLSSYCALQRATLLKISKGDELESHSNSEFLWFERIQLQENQERRAFPPFPPQLFRILVLRMSDCPSPTLTVQPASGQLMHSTY
ncbi:hypothetical protein BRARA_D02589 [Brassica rapa]|uniref:Uncharacterized protein n=1 Tax=Brassica campestris TaxID=3711 RepID=A0A397ZPP8_BRACM|nr:hypothetical protein BRARA_D02589 [Brassica rapa]